MCAASGRATDPPMTPQTPLCEAPLLPAPFVSPPSTACLQPQVLLCPGLSCNLPKLMCTLPPSAPGYLRGRMERLVQAAVIEDARNWPCRGACDTVERAFNYAWMQAGLGLDSPGQQQGQLPRVCCQS